MSELKRPERYVQFESIKPGLKEITEFYTQKVTDYQYRLKQLNEYADSLENEISVLKETPKVEVLLDDMPKPLVVVPQTMADFIEEWKEEFKLYGAFFEIAEAYGPGTELYDWIFQKSNEQDLFARAWLDGYTVEKEQLYVLEFPNRTNPYVYYLKSNMITQQCSQIEDAKRFTESEIKAIDERYWAFAVKVD